EQAAVREDIRCDFVRVDGYLFEPPEKRTDHLEREAEAARRAGLRVETVPRAPLPRFDTGPCLRFRDQAQYNPTRFLAGLVQAIRRAGGKVFTGVRASDIEGGTPARVKTRSDETVEADAVVVATNTPVN